MATGAKEKLLLSYVLSGRRAWTGRGAPCVCPPGRTGELPPPRCPFWQVLPTMLAPLLKNPSVTRVTEAACALQRQGALNYSIVRSYSTFASPFFTPVLSARVYPINKSLCVLIQCFFSGLSYD